MGLRDIWGVWGDCVDLVGIGATKGGDKGCFHIFYERDSTVLRFIFVGCMYKFVGRC